MEHSHALSYAIELVECLRPVCTRIEIAGSVRRLKPDVKDIEIVAIPDLTPLPRPRPEFGKPIPVAHKTRLDKLVADMEETGEIDLALNGPRLKKLWLKKARIFVDLFICIPPSDWGVQMVIRTGSSDFSHWCVSSRRIGGALPIGHFVKHQIVWIESEINKIQVPDNQDKAISVLTDSNHIAMPEETDFLKFCGLGWIGPKDRQPRWTK